MGRVSVDTANDRLGRRRFAEVPYALYRDEPRWAPPPLARVERRQRFRRRGRANPFFVDGEASFFVVRIAGRVAGRVSAHVRHEGDEGWFGFFECVNDADAAGELLAAAAEWLSDTGCTTMTGPASYVVEESGGVLVSGDPEDCVTGRPWTPDFYPALLEGAGLAPAGDLAHWRIPLADPPGMAPGPDLGVRPADLPLPLGLAPFADPRLLLEVGDIGHITAVPDLNAAQRGQTPASGAVNLAKRRRDRNWDTAVVLEIAGPEKPLVSALLWAAAAAGYADVVSPWSPNGGPPTLVHRLYRLALTDPRPAMSRRSTAADGAECDHR